MLAVCRAKRMSVCVCVSKQIVTFEQSKEFKKKEEKKNSVYKEGKKCDPISHFYKTIKRK